MIDIKLNIGYLFNNPRRKEYFIISNFDIIQCDLIKVNLISDYILLDENLKLSNNVFNKIGSIDITNNKITVNESNKKSIIYKKYIIERNKQYDFILSIKGRPYNNTDSCSILISTLDDKQYYKSKVCNVITFKSDYNMIVKISIVFDNKTIERYIIDRFVVTESTRDKCNYQFYKDYDYEYIISRKTNYIHNIVDLSDDIIRRITNNGFDNSCKILNINLDNGMTLNSINNKGYNNMYQLGSNTNNMIDKILYDISLIIY
jgi:hypothetical protein